jgi:hypothetical protein
MIVDNEMLWARFATLEYSDTTDIIKISVSKIIFFGGVLFFFGN